MFTTEELKQLAKSIAKQRMDGLLAIKGSLGDAFNQTVLANAIGTAEAESYIDRRVLAAQRYARLIPVNTTIPASAGDVLRRGFKNAVGMGKRHSGSGKDIPLAEVTYGNTLINIDMGVIGYQYGVGELEAASRGNIALDSDKIAAARLAFEKHMYNVAMVGDAETGKEGLLNNSTVEVSVAAGAWTTATPPKQMLADISAAIAIAFDESAITGDISMLPDTILLPSTIFTLLNDTFMSETSAVTVLEYLKEKNILTASGVPNVTFEILPELATMGSDGGNRIVMYLNDPSAVEFILPKDLTFLPPQPEGVEIFTAGWYVYGGTWIKTKESVIYLDGV